MKKIAMLLFITSSFVFAQNTYVPDDKFEQALIDLGYDTTLDDSVLTANISGVTALEVYGKEISDLTGIEGFTALKELYCWSNQLTSLDVSKNTALVRLKCANNKLTSLDVSNNTALNELESNLNQLTSLDVTANTVLTYLRVDDNQLISLDVSKNVALENLLCYRNQLTSLDVSKNTALRELSCYNNQLTSLDVSKNTALTTLLCYSNQLTSLDVSKNVALTGLSCHSNQLTSLDVSKNVALTGLSCYNNQLTSLDVSKNTALTSLRCYYNQLTSLDVSKNTALRELRCYYNQLTSLDVSKNTALIKFDSRYNQLTSLNFRNGITDALTKFRVTSNPNLYCIETLDPTYATTNWTDIDAGVTFSLSCMEDFEWVSSPSDTIYITQSNLADTYTLEWDASTDIDGDAINYIIYAKIGLYPTEEVEEITDTAFQLVYEEILEQVFEGSPANGATVKFQVIAKKGVYSKDVTGDDRTLYISRYDYLSVENESIPTEFALHENYPNPFNPSTTLRFDLPEVSNITLTIFNMLGQKIRTYDMQSAAAGYHTLKWNATNDYGYPVGAGVYLYQLQSKDFVKTRKMVLLK
ncbi:T9SS type A sorting domain-containing protein [Candidatus Marinimicrobia bacterium]|nr:T9SS type A sorting domain-containing protein [Candidatus Neomarinimicrobiota bacterium]